MPKYYECIRGYLYRQSYMGKTALGEGIYSMTKNVVDDALPSLFEKTTLLSANIAEQFLGENTKIFLYEPSVDMNGVRMRAFHCSHSRQSIKTKQRRGDDEEQINVLFATEIPEGKYATMAFKSGNRFVEYGDIPISKDLPFVQEDEIGYLTPSEVMWYASKDEAGRDSAELLRALLNTPNGSITYLAYPFDKLEEATRVIFSVLELLPPHIANEICFCNCMISRVSYDGAKIFGVPVSADNKSRIEELKSRGEVLVLGSKYEKEYESAYVDLISLGDLEGFNKRYFDKCKTIYDLDRYAELYAYVTRRLTPERAQSTLDFAFKFLNGENDLKQMDSSVKSDVVELILSCLDMLTSVKIRISNEQAEQIAVRLGALCLSNSERESIAHSISAQLMLDGVLALMDRIDDIGRALDPDGKVMINTLADMWEKNEGEMLTAYERALDDVSVNALDRVIKPTLTLSRNVSATHPELSSRLKKCALALTFRNDAVMLLEGYDLFLPYVSEIIAMINGEWDTYKPKLDIALAKASNPRPCFELYKELYREGKLSTPLAMLLLNKFLDHGYADKLTELLYDGEKIEKSIEKCLSIISALTDKNKGNALVKSLDVAIKSTPALGKSTEQDPKLIAFRTFYKKIKNPIAKFFVSSLYGDVVDLIMADQSDWHDRSSGQGLTHSPLKRAIREIEREDADELEKMRTALISKIPNAVAIEMNAWLGTPRASLKNSPLHTELTELYSKKDDDAYIPVLEELVMALPTSLRLAQEYWERSAHGKSLGESPLFEAAEKMAPLREASYIKTAYDEIINIIVTSTENSLPKIVGVITALEAHAKRALRAGDVKAMRILINSALLSSLDNANIGSYRDNGRLNSAISAINSISASDYAMLISRLEAVMENNNKKERMGGLDRIAKKRLLACVDRCPRARLEKILNGIRLGKASLDDKASLYNKDKEKCGSMDDKRFIRYAKFRLSNGREYDDEFSMLHSYELTEDDYQSIQQELLVYLGKPSRAERAKVIGIKIASMALSMLLISVACLVTREIWINTFSGFGMLMCYIACGIAFVANAVLQVPYIILNSYKYSRDQRIRASIISTVSCAAISILIPLLILLCF